MTSAFSIRPGFGKLLDGIQLFGLGGFSFFALLTGKPSRIGLSLLVLFCLLDPRFWSAARRSVLAWLAGLLLVYIALRGGVAMWLQPDIAEFHRRDGALLAILPAFIMIGWAMRGEPRRILFMFGLLVAGFVLACIDKYEPLRPGIEWWWQQRQQFGFTSANAFGKWAAVSTLGFVVMAPAIWRASRGRWFFWLVMPVWMAGIVVGAQGVIASQSRAVWLGLLVVAPVLVVLWAARTSGFQWRRAVLPGFVVLLCLAVLGYANRDIVEKRLASERETWDQIVSGELADVEGFDSEGEVKSIGTRIRMLVFATGKWLERPVFGWGPGITRPLIKQTPGDLFAHKSHFHNTYAEVLLRLGIVGALILLACVVAGWSSLVRAWKQGRVSHELFAFLTAALVLIMVLTFFRFSLTDREGRLYWMLIGGAMAGFSLRQAMPAREGSQA